MQTAKRRRRVRIHGSVDEGLDNREAMKMVNSVQMLLLGIVIISAIGSIFGYMLEPGRYAKREAAELSVNSSGAETQTANHSPRLAA